MSKTQVVFYSRTGNTRKVGEILAKKLNCKCEEIIDKKKRKGALRLLEAVINPKAPTTIKDMNDPNNNLVIIGTPIWWYTQAPAVKAYLEKYKPRKVAFFYTCGADSKITAFEDMEKACGVKPTGILRIDKHDMKVLEKSEKINEFVKALQHSI